MAGEKIIIYISSLGCSVVDYCLVEKEDFDNFSNFEVTTVSDLERSLNYQATDHSVLSWLLFSNTLLQNENDTTSHEDNESFSYNYKKIPPDFLQTCITDISLLSEAILSNSMNQTLLDEIYSKFCDIVKAEIQNKLPYIKRKFPSKKSWWNYSLNSAQKECQRAQKQWLNCKGDREVKQHMRREFRCAHNYYMSMIRKANSKRFWEKSKKLLHKHHKMKKKQFSVHMMRMVYLDLPCQDGKVLLKSFSPPPKPILTNFLYIHLQITMMAVPKVISCSMPILYARQFVV